VVKEGTQIIARTVVGLTSGLVWAKLSQVPLDVKLITGVEQADILHPHAGEWRLVNAPACARAGLFKLSSGLQRGVVEKQTMHIWRTGEFNIIPRSIDSFLKVNYLETLTSI
jgi:hypothetical protein